MPHRSRIGACAVVAALATFACDGPRDLSWTVRFADNDLRSRAQAVEVSIVAGDCSSGAEPEWTDVVRPGAAEGMRPPVLEEGEWSFRARARDDGCDYYAAGCTPETLGSDGVTEVLTILDGVAEQSACAADETCVAGECSGGGVDGGLDAGGLMDGGDAGDLDAGEDDAGLPDGGPCAAWSAEHFDPCAIPAPEPMLVIDEDASYDTDTGMLMVGAMTIPLPGTVLMQGGSPARLISVQGLSIDARASLRVTGSSPLVVASWSSIQIDGDLDVSSGRMTGAGAGAGSGPCMAPTSGGAGVSGSGGGGGGGFGAAGGMGGRGDGNGLMLAGGAAGGARGVPSIVRGGCAGAAAGDGVAGERGAGGPGGGAVQLTALSAIRVEGRILAGGAAGQGGPMSSTAGGGGGGSGGYIGLDAPRVRVVGMATLAANGGGGGEGCDMSTAGANGEDARPTDTAAAGGAGSSNLGTAGGAGGFSMTPAGASVTGIDSGGGGGGGGSVGYIVVHSGDFSAEGTATVTPSQELNP